MHNMRSPPVAANDAFSPRSLPAPSPQQEHARSGQDGSSGISKPMSQSRARSDSRAMDTSEAGSSGTMGHLLNGVGESRGLPAASSGTELFSAAEAQFMEDSLSSADKMDVFGDAGFRVPANLPPRLGFGTDTIMFDSPSSYAEAPGQAPPGIEKLNFSSAHESSSRQVPDASNPGLMSPETLHAQTTAARALLGSRPAWDSGPDQRWTPLFNPSTTSRGSHSPSSTRNGAALYMEGAEPTSNLRDVADTLRKKKAGVPEVQDVTMHSLAKTEVLVGGFQELREQAGHPLGPPSRPTDYGNAKNALPLSAAALDAHHQVFGPPKVRKPPSSNATAAESSTAEAFLEPSAAAALTEGVSQESSFRARLSAASGYGSDPQWKMQQLQFLQEQRDKHLQQKREEQALKQRAQHQQQPAQTVSAAMTQKNGPSLMEISQAFPSSHSFPGPHAARMSEQKKSSQGTKMAATSSANSASDKPPAAAPERPNAIVFNASGWQTSQPDIEIDVERGRGTIPDHLAQLFFEEEEHKKQPHLRWLRDLIASGQIEDPQIKIREQEALREQERKSKDPHTLLTDAEKKANHIASEQKRRANIKKGYEGLNGLVPALRDAADKSGAPNGAGEESDEEESDDDGKKKGGKGEEKDAKGGPRSEAVVLQKTLKHMREQLELHARLINRRRHAKAALAAQFGLDIKVPTSPSQSTEQKG